MPSLTFSAASFPPLTLLKNASLSEYLTVQNSPVLFGCRTGICGTCLVEVEGNVTPPAAEEREVLEIVAPDNPKARLACQIVLTDDLTVSKLNAT